ncbi:MAG: glycosyltransferase family 9 protein [Gemmatimonadota bacterium]
MAALRKLEKGLRRLTLAAVSRRRGRALDDPFGEELPARARILLIRVDRIGDAIISTPLIRELRRTLPHAMIDILLGEKNQAISPLLSDLDGRFVLRRREALATLGDLRGNHYDVVVNLHLNRSASASLATRLIAPTAVIDYPAADPFRAGGALAHAVVMTWRLLGPFGVDAITEAEAPRHPLHLKLPEASAAYANQIEKRFLGQGGSGRRVFINVSASDPSRAWSRKRFGELARALTAAGWTAVLTGAPGDETALRRAALVGGPEVVALPPVDSYADFAATVSLADLIVTVDGSTAHLGAALGKPAVVLFGHPDTAKAWRPWGVPYRIATSPLGLAGIESSQVCKLVRDLEIGIG